MYGFIQALFGFLAFLALIAIIKPSLFHRFYKNLNRKHAALAFVVIVIVINSGIGKIVERGDLKEQQEATKLQADRDAVAQVADAQHKAENDRLQAEKDAKRVAEEAKQAVFKQIVVNASVVKNIINVNEVHADIKNGTDKAIDGVDLYFYLTNNFGEPVGQWAMKADDPLAATSQETIQPGKTVRSLSWTALGYETASKVSKVVVDRIHFTDGTTVENTNK